MVTVLSYHQEDFLEKIDETIYHTRDVTGDVSTVVADIIQNIKLDGDKALCDYTAQFDKWDITPETMRVSQERLEQAKKDCPDAVKKAIEHSAQRIRSFHEKQKPDDMFYEDNIGVGLGMRYTPIDAVGVYIPGGAASYPSSVLMNVIPAKVAGVGRIVAVVPAPLGQINPAVLYALDYCGIDEIYLVGGAQAVAALAYGTQTIKKVDKITGPGNAFVAEAKRQVYGIVGIDSIAGPSEILVIADNTAEIDYVVADLLSQAEHDAVAQSILLTDCDELAVKVLERVGELVKTLPKADIAQRSWDDYGIVITVESLEQACEISNLFAPEHLELAVTEPKKLLPLIRHAGAIFMGHYTPEAIGDYIAGPNHVLPTGRSSRFSSGLGTADFMKRTTMIACNQESFNHLAKDTYNFAKAEGLDAHALSISVRTDLNKN